MVAAGEIMPSVCCGLSSKNGSVMSSSQRPGLSGPLEASRINTRACLLRTTTFSAQLSAQPALQKPHGIPFNFTLNGCFFVQILYVPVNYSLVAFCEAFVINDFCLGMKKEK